MSGPDQSSLAVAGARFEGGEAESWPEPSPEELTAIDAEWPLLAAELAVVECRAAGHPGQVSRRGVRRALRALAHALASRPPVVKGVGDVQASA